MARFMKFDGWMNVLTGLGVSGSDKKVGAAMQFSPMAPKDASALYAGNDIAETIVDFPVDEAFRKEFKFFSAEKGEEIHNEVMALFSQYDFLTKFTDAAKRARLQGKAFILIGGNGVSDYSLPLEIKGPFLPGFLTVLDREELKVEEINNDITSPGFKTPASYSLKNADSNVAGKIHASRLIILNGSKLPFDSYKDNSYSHDSVLNKVAEAIRDYDAGFSGAATILTDFTQGIYKIKNLAHLIASGREKDVVARLKLIDTTKSIVKATVLDAEEDYTRQTPNNSGHPEMLSKFENRLVTASKMPHTIILGDGSTGTLSGAGESEAKVWANFIKGLQVSQYKPELLRFAKILLGQAAPADLDIDFPPIVEMSEKDKSEIYRNMAQGDQIYLVNQVLDPDEVALSRFGGRDFSLDTTLLTERTGAE